MLLNISMWKAELPGEKDYKVQMRAKSYLNKFNMN